MGMLDGADFRRASSIDRVEMPGRVTHGKRAVYAGHTDTRKGDPRQESNVHRIHTYGAGMTCGKRAVYAGQRC